MLKASQVIKKLQELIDQNGDHPLQYIDVEGNDVAVYDIRFREIPKDGQTYAPAEDYFGIVDSPHK